MELPALLLYVGIIGGFGAWMNGLFGAVEQIWQNKELIDRYRELMDFGIVDEGKKLLFIPEGFMKYTWRTLEEGTIAEEGKHEELIKKNGAYAELFRLLKKIHSVDSAIIPLHLLEPCLSVAQLYVNLFLTAGLIDTLLAGSYEQAVWQAGRLLLVNLVYGVTFQLLRRKFHGMKNRI